MPTRVAEHLMNISLFALPQEDRQHAIDWATHPETVNMPQEVHTHILEQLADGLAQDATGWNFFDPEGAEYMQGYISSRAATQEGTVLGSPATQAAEVQAPEGGATQTEQFLETLQEGEFVQNGIEYFQDRPDETAMLVTQALEAVYPSYEFITPQQGMQRCVEHCLVVHHALSAKANKVAVDNKEPKTYWEAMDRHDADKWLEAARAEMKALIDNGTWERVLLPQDRKAVGSKWVFKVKRNAYGDIERYKARLVAQGFSQRPGMDFIEDQTFAPTMRFAAIRSILALAAIEDWEIESVDISNAYLNGVMPPDQVVYMKQAPGFDKGDGMVYQLKKGLYGLKQAGRLWYEKLGKTMEAAGLKKLVSDPAIYVWGGQGVRVIVPVFVDDVTILSKSTERVKWIKSVLGKAFKVHDLGPISFLLGIKIVRDRKNRTMHLDQSQYIIDLLERFDMQNCAPVDTPMTPGLQLTKDDCPKTPEEIAEMAGVPYQTAVGALNYLAVATCPDISYTVAKLAKFNSCPGPRMWQAVKRLLRYLQGSKDLKLTYAPDPLSKSLFTTFTDAAFADDRDTGRSTNGYIVKIGTGAVSWSSKLQGPVAKSSTEAEFYGASFAVAHGSPSCRL